MIRCESSQAKCMYFVLIHCQMYQHILDSLVLVYESGREIDACCTRAWRITHEGDVAKRLSSRVVVASCRWPRGERQGSDSMLPLRA